MYFWIDSDVTRLIGYVGAVENFTKLLTSIHKNFSRLEIKIECDRILIQKFLDKNYL